eukprot:g81563.t1
MQECDASPSSRRDGWTHSAHSRMRQPSCLRAQDEEADERHEHSDAPPAHSFAPVAIPRGLPQSHLVGVKRPRPVPIRAVSDTLPSFSTAIEDQSSLFSERLKHRHRPAMSGMVPSQGDNQQHWNGMEGAAEGLLRLQYRPPTNSRAAPASPNSSQQREQNSSQSVRRPMPSPQGGSSAGLRDDSRQYAMSHRGAAASQHSEEPSYAAVSHDNIKQRTQPKKPQREEPSYAALSHDNIKQRTQPKKPQRGNSTTQIAPQPYHYISGGQASEGTYVGSQSYQQSSAQGSGRGGAYYPSSTSPPAAELEGHHSAAGPAPAVNAARLQPLQQAPYPSSQSQPGQSARSAWPNAPPPGGAGGPPEAHATTPNAPSSQVGNISSGVMNREGWNYAYKFQTLGPNGITHKPLVLFVKVMFASLWEAQFSLQLKISENQVKRRRNTKLQLVAAWLDARRQNVVMSRPDPGQGMSHLICLTPSDSTGFLTYVETKGGASIGRPQQRYLHIRGGALYTICCGEPFRMLGLTLKDCKDVGVSVAWTAANKVDLGKLLERSIVLEDSRRGTHQQDSDQDLGKKAYCAGEGEPTMAHSAGYHPPTQQAQSVDYPVVGATIRDGPGNIHAISNVLPRSGSSSALPVNLSRSASGTALPTTQPMPSRSGSSSMLPTVLLPRSVSSSHIPPAHVSIAPYSPTIPSQQPPTSPPEVRTPGVGRPRSKYQQSPSTPSTPSTQAQTQSEPARPVQSEPGRPVQAKESTTLQAGKKRGAAGSAWHGSGSGEPHRPGRPPAAQPLHSSNAQPPHSSNAQPPHSSHAQPSHSSHAQPPHSSHKSPSGPVRNVLSSPFRAERSISIEGSGATKLSSAGSVGHHSAFTPRSTPSVLSEQENDSFSRPVGLQLHDWRYGPHPGLKKLVATSRRHVPHAPGMSVVRPVPTNTDGIDMRTLLPPKQPRAAAAASSGEQSTEEVVVEWQDKEREREGGQDKDEMSIDQADNQNHTKRPRSW